MRIPRWARTRRERDNLQVEIPNPARTPNPAMTAQLLREIRDRLELPDSGRA